MAGLSAVHADGAERRGGAAGGHAEIVQQPGRRRWATPRSRPIPNVRRADGTLSTRTARDPIWSRARSVAVSGGRGPTETAASAFPRIDTRRPGPVDRLGARADGRARRCWCRYCRCCSTTSTPSRRARETAGLFGHARPPVRRRGQTRRGKTRHAAERRRHRTGGGWWASAWSHRPASRARSATCAGRGCRCLPPPTCHQSPRARGCCGFAGERAAGQPARGS